jgi:hypothetical protein
MFKKNWQQEKGLSNFNSLVPPGAAQGSRRFDLCIYMNFL